MSPTFDSKSRCNGCGVAFRPRLDGDYCPTCAEVLIAEDLDEDDFEQHRLREEYGRGSA